MTNSNPLRVDAVISDFIQDELKRKKLASVTAIEAAGWLDRAGILRDSTLSPGLPLRKRLRKGMVRGQRQEAGRWWHIDFLDARQKLTD